MLPVGVGDRLLGLSGVAVVLGAAVWAWAGGSAAPVATLVAIGLVLTAADALVWATVGSAGEPDLAVPERSRLAQPRWGTLVALAAALGVAGTVRAGSAATAVGAGVVLGVAVSSMRPPRSELPAHVVSIARRLRRFARAHGTPRGEAADGYVTPVGESGARLVVVAPDGAWADAMVAVGDVAAIAGLARIEVRDRNDPGAARGMRIGRTTWEQMARSW
jgi:hypothetical protein